ncbi:MAG TPA: CoA pyrophosphatase [candidate division Zixibacteria bacterium]|nr:CoA pyrophosphatase [candidate division Zixibacteria bacterium]
MVFSIEELSANLRAVSDEQDANAAVALLLRIERERPCALFVRRVQNSRDPWSGQMALPGGKREAKDKDLKETVIRETLEETNINLLDNCRFLGVMSTFQSKPRPEIRVLPFVILTENGPSIRLNREELEDYFWIPLEELVRNRTTARFSFGEVPAFVVGSTVIWGLTYRIVECLLNHCLETGTQL